MSGACGGKLIDGKCAGSGLLAGMARAEPLPCALQWRGLLGLRLRMLTRQVTFANCDNSHLHSKVEYLILWQCCFA